MADQNTTPPPSDRQKMAAYPRKIGHYGWLDLPDRHPCLVKVNRQWRVAVWNKAEGTFRLVSGGQAYDPVMLGTAHIREKA